MNTFQHSSASIMPVVSPQPVSRRKALLAHGMLSAHVMAGFKAHGFYLDISGQSPELLSSNEKIRIPLNTLTYTQLQAVKDLAQDQYVRAMLEGSLELDTHRATLNFVSRQLQKAAHIPASKAPIQNRKTRRPSRGKQRVRTTSQTPVQAA